MQTRNDHHAVIMPGNAYPTLKFLARASRRMLSACGLSLSACVAAQAATPLQANSTGVFINDRGDVLVARHAVSNCSSLFALKDGRVAKATVLAIDEHADVAVIGTDLKPYLTATFAHTQDLGKGGKPVFAESYEVLRGQSVRTTMFNALTVPGGGLSLLSPARPGASGSAVLDGGGLLQGMVIERVALAPAVGSITLSQTAASAAGATTGASYIRAVPVAGITAFLRAHGIPFSESDVPQLGRTQAVAPRALTLAVGVICG